MVSFACHIEELRQKGFVVIDNIYQEKEIKFIINKIEQLEADQPELISGKLYAIRQVFKVVPELRRIILNDRLNELIKATFGESYFIVKAIYFDKPESSNWFVAWHQDLTIAVKDKVEAPGYLNWTNKQNQYAVQPPVAMLIDNFTIRIHLDDTDDTNGALKVLPGTHLVGIHRFEHNDNMSSRAISCKVKSGGVMIMRPLLMHSSDRSTSKCRRRVIHIEFSRQQLTYGLEWAEA